MLSCSSSLQDLSDSRSGRHLAAYTPAFVARLSALESAETGRASGSTSLHLSQHAAILTPGPPQVLAPFPSLRVKPSSIP
jgi:hypothetical protein